MGISENSPRLKQAFWWPKNSTMSRTLTGTDSGTAWTNLNSTGPITFTLPKAAVGLTTVVSGLAFQFLVATAQSVVITPKTGDTIRGLAASASLTLTAVGQLIELECIENGFWDMIGGNTFPDGVTITGTGTIGGNTIPTQTTGSFTGTFTGFTATVTGTVNWVAIGKMVIMTIPAASGTSNATSFTMTGIPAAIQPATANTMGNLAGNVVQNNTAYVTCDWTINGGTMTFFNGASEGSASWTAAGTKGFLNPAFAVYSLQ
jgi:hypothetical protein